MDHYTRRVLATYEKAIRRAQEQIAALERQDR
jgi:hypothetical protein